ncbi:MAG: hypothetical protein WCQ16_12965, partial [Verrucomicrobiae bacterium]
LENMSPEQAESSKDVDERADVYALGSILYQMLTGCRHFEATGNIVADAQALQHHEPPRPRSVNPRLDSDLEIILLKALRNAPVERYRSVAALEADLEHYRRGEVISARPVTALELARKLVLRNRAITAVITVSLLVFLAGSVAAFWQITDRAKAAETALARAEKQEKLALENKLRADEQRKEAEAAFEKLAKANTERDAADAARTEAVKAKVAADAAATLAQSQTAQERQSSEAAAKAATVALVGADEKLTEAQRRIEDLQARAAAPQQTAAPPRRHPFEYREKFLQTSRAMNTMNEALMAFQRDLNPFQLLGYKSNPEMIRKFISSGLETASQAILLDPTLSQAWMMKGRYHLACMEVAQAREAFQIAEKSAETRREANQPDLLGPDRPQDLIAICDQLSKPVFDRMEKAAALLNSTGSATDQITAGVIQFLQDKPIAHKSTISSSPTGRVPGTAEAAVGLMAANGGIGQVVVEGGGHELSITGIPGLLDLSALKSLSPQPVRIKIRGADALDWGTLAALPLESLDLAGYGGGGPPAGLRGFAKIQSLSLKDSGVSDLSWARMMPSLATLDISGTPISDLGPLATSRRLQSLDISGLTVGNVKILALLPLTRLTLSPIKISDKASLNILRGHRTIRILRAPGDPDNQTAAEFWRKLDAREYDG